MKQIGFGAVALLAALLSGAALTAPKHRISDVEIAIAARDCLSKGMSLYVVRENRKPVATTCITESSREYSRTGSTATNRRGP